MIPTADQAARIIIAAFRECRADPLTVINSFKGTARHETGPNYRGMCGRRYAALAMRDLFPACPSRKIGRMVGCHGYNADALIGELTSAIARGKASWFDPEVLARIVAAVGIEKSLAEQIEIDETEKGIRAGAAAHGIDPQVAVAIHRRESQPAPVQLSTPFYTRPRAKLSLEEELRKAVLNTGGRLAK